MIATDQSPRARQPATSGRLSTAGRLLRFALRRVSEEKLTQVASSLTFTTVLAIVPLLAVVLSLFTAFPLFADFRVALEGFLASNLMPANVSADIMEYLNQFAQQASKLTAIGGLFLVVTSVMLIMTIDGALNDIWHVSRQRPLAQRILVYWAVISLGPVLLGGSLWATSVLARASMGLAGDLSPLVNIALSVVPVLLTGIAFTALFVMVPNRLVEWRDAAIGGFCTAILLEAMKAGFAYYISRFPSYTIIYGTFATVPVFLLWLYLSWLGVMVGAVLASSLPGVRLHGLQSDATPAGAPFLDALKILRALYADWSSSGGQGLSIRELGASLDIHPEDLDSVLDTLQNLGLVAPARVRGKERWLLKCDPRRATIGPLIDKLLITRGAASATDSGDNLLQATAAALQPPGHDTTLEALLSGEAGNRIAGLSHDAAVPPISSFLSRPSLDDEVSHHAKSQ